MTPLISILAMICGADTWKDIETFSISKEKFLQTFLELPNGTSKLDTPIDEYLLL
jgi:hypothetical protein